MYSAEPNQQPLPDPLPTCEELDRQIQDSIIVIQADMEAYDERAALQAVDDRMTTTERALAALERPERFRGEHQVAHAWLLRARENGARFRRIIR